MLLTCQLMPNYLQAGFGLRFRRAGIIIQRKYDRLSGAKWYENQPWRLLVSFSAANNISRNETENYARRIVTMWCFGPGGSIRQLHQILYLNPPYWRFFIYIISLFQCIIYGSKLQKKTGHCEENRSFCRVWSYFG